MYKFNVRYKMLVEQLQTTENLFLKDPYNETSIHAYICKGISREFDEVDKLKNEIEKLKLEHLDEIVDLKEKISHLIDQNYKLLQLFNKD